MVKRKSIKGLEKYTWFLCSEHELTRKRGNKSKFDKCTCADIFHTLNCKRNA